MGLTNVGRDFVAQAIINDASPTFFSQANAYVGVGDSSAAFSAAQTDLQASSNKYRKQCEVTHPTRTNNSITYRVIVASGNGNFAWNEWGLFNAPSGGTMLLRKNEALGTKNSSQTWQLDVVITFDSSASSGGGGTGSVTGMLDDGVSHPAPATGAFAYNTFVPGASYTDPVFGTTVKRLTSDHATDDLYARAGFWNANGTRYLHKTTIQKVSDGSIEYSNIPVGARSFDRSFDPVNPDVLYYMSGNTIRKITLGAGGAFTDVVYLDVGTPTLSLGGETDWLDAVGTHMIVRYGSEPSIHVFDRTNLAAGPYTGAVDGSHVETGGGHVGITPDGKFVIRTGVTTGTPACSGGNGVTNNALYSYAINPGSRSVAGANEFWTLGCAHIGYVSASNGHSYAIVTGNWQPYIYAIDVSYNAYGQCNNTIISNARLLLSPASWDYARHLAGAKKGTYQDWAFISVEDVTDVINSGSNSGGFITPWKLYQSEIIAMNVLTGEVRRLAHHRSRSISDYRYQPRVSCSWGAEVVGFASNFNQADIIDTFCIPFGL
jgi:hypothetical protein